MTRSFPSNPLFSRAQLRRLGLTLAAFVLAAGCAVGAAQAQTDSDAIDPPGRVGKISLLAGQVTMIDLQTGAREDATLNWPITGGWRLETGRNGRAEVRIGSTALRLDDDSTVDFARLDDQFMQIAVLRGSAAVRVRNRDILDELELVTQRERIVLEDVGHYRIDVDRVPEQTALTTFTGRARILSGNGSFEVASGQRGEVSAPPMTRFQLFAAVSDRFDDWVAARDARDDSIRSAAYVSRETTGVEVLDDYGDWRTVSDYGPVWFPRTIDSGWAPYRYGRWAWVEPWGWTWIDEAPWGFAPFHYGRWAVIGGVWGWVPGVIVARPVYAPALVAWFGAPGVSVSIGAPIGWFPLGPREVYVPAYRYSPRYLRVVNVQHVTNVNRITIVQTPRYVHRHPDRSTWLPGDRFGRRDPVHRSVRPPPSEWRQYIARPQPPVNVPNTKRRQDLDAARPRSATPTAVPSVRGAPAATPAPIVRPPASVPPARAIQAPRAQPVQPPAATPERRGRDETGSVPRDDRRVAPRAPIAPPASGFVAQPVQTPSSALPEQRGRDGTGPMPREDRRVAPRVSRAPAANVAPAAQPVPARPGTTAVTPPVRVQPRVVAPTPATPPAAHAPVQRGRGESNATPRDERRMAPRPPARPAAAPAPIPANPVQAGPRESGRGYSGAAQPQPRERPGRADGPGNERSGGGRPARAMAR